MEEPKKNSVHVRAVEQIQVQIKELHKQVSSKGDNSLELPAIKELIAELRTDISGKFNNREMAIVLTKLQEAQHWCDEEKITKVSERLTEARNWAGEYVKVLIG